MNKLSIIKEFFQFLRARRKWVLLPVILFLLLLGAFVFLSQGSAVAPFIYTIF